MVKSLYKFMPFREIFFENFLLRASHINTLNDPFEMEPSIEWWANLFLELKDNRFGKTKEEIFSYIKKQNSDSLWKHLGTDLFKDKGIISFTETKENILMWSHYSNNHTGIVIEFDLTHPFFSEKFREKEDNYLGSPQKVLYRRERLITSDYLLEPYFHKSSDWIYEQEYRMLLRLVKRDKTLIHNKYCDENFKEECVFRSHTGELARIDENFFEIKNSYNPSLINNPNTMFMFKITPNAIKSIYLGCRMKSINKNKLIKLKEKEELKHIKLYESSMNDKKYELNFFEI